MTKCKLFYIFTMKNTYDVTEQDWRSATTGSLYTWGGCISGL